MYNVDCSLRVFVNFYYLFPFQGHRINLLMDDINESTERDSMAADGKTGWAMINDPTPAFRLIIMLGLFLSFAQQAVGIDAMQYLSLDILKELLWADSDMSLMTKDLTTGLYPFALAAASHHEDSDYDLDVVYTLLNAHPQALSLQLPHHQHQLQEQGQQPSS